MSRFFIKTLASGPVPGVFSGMITSSLGVGRYRVVAGDGTTITASSAGKTYARGERVRLRGTEIVGLIRPLENIKKYEV